MLGGKQPQLANPHRCNYRSRELLRSPTIARRRATSVRYAQ
jgi:hypothetical protein